MNERPEQPSKAAKFRNPLRLVLLIAAGLTLIAGLAACGKDSPKKSATNPEAPDPTVFDVEIDMSTGAGPVPLKVAYKSRVANAKGKVTYKWTFDEGGATSTEPNPTFTYKKTGWKLARVKAVDEAGHKSDALQPIRVWPVDVWNGVTSGKYSPQKSQAILVANLKAYERKTGGKIAGISAPPLPGQKPLTPESRRAQRRQPALERRAARRATRALERKQRQAAREKQQKSKGN